MSLFIIGGLSGIFMAATPVDIYIHDTYFIVAHLHYVLFTSSLFGIFAGIYYWFPKMFGRMMNETLGQGPLRPDVHRSPTARSSRCTSSASPACARRIADITPVRLLKRRCMPLNQFISISAFVLGLAQIIFVVNFFYSLFWGKKAGRNPWNSNTLEWTAPSPPPHGNFDVDADRLSRALRIRRARRRRTTTCRRPQPTAGSRAGDAAHQSRMPSTGYAREPALHERGASSSTHNR